MENNLMVVFDKDGKRLDEKQMELMKKASDEVSFLQKAGFGTLANKVGFEFGLNCQEKLQAVAKYGYKVIRVKKIKELLESRMRPLVRQVGFSSKTSGSFSSVDRDFYGFQLKEKREKLRSFVTCFVNWVEIPIERYKDKPPRSVIETISEHASRKIFDDIRIVKVTTQVDEIKKPLPDPIAVGILDDRPERYFICQWDNDLLLDDLI